MCMQNFTRLGGSLVVGLAALSMACSSKDKNYDAGNAYSTGVSAAPVDAVNPIMQAAEAVPAEPLPPLTPEEIGPTTNYTVKTGDSLWLIAKNHKSSIGRLKRINQLTSNNIQIGQTLKIPSTGGKPAASATPSAAPPAAASTPAKTVPAASGGFRRPSAAATPPVPAAPKPSGLKIQD